MKKLFILTSVLSMSYTANAQYKTGNVLALIGWEISMPVSNDFISETSFTGGYFEYRKFVKPQLSVGLGISFSSFGEYVNGKTYVSEDGNQAITTDMQRIIYSMPITANAHYYFPAGPKVSPYIGLGAGAQYVDQWALFSSYDLSDRSWGFVVRPSLGILFSFSESLGGHLGVAYNWATNNNRYFEQKSFQAVCFQLGFVINPNVP